MSPSEKFTPLEKDVEKQLRHMVGRHHGLCLKWTCPGWSGVPDRICLFPGGYVVFVELKRPEGGRTAPRQAEWYKMLKGLGFDVYFVRSHEEVRFLELAIRDALGRVNK